MGRRASENPASRQRGVRQHPADRLDPVFVAVLLDEVHHHFRPRSRSAWARKADAWRSLVFARFSSLFSRSRLSEMKWEKAGMEEYGGGHEMAQGAPGSAGEQQRGVE